MYIGDVCIVDVSTVKCAYSAVFDKDTVREIREREERERERERGRERESSGDPRILAMGVLMPAKRAI